MVHASVLLKESIDGLDIRSGDVFLDCTLGGGGHSLEVWKRHGTSVTIVGLDADSDAIARATERLTASGCVITALNASFKDLDAALDGAGIGNVDRVLMDLGLSSNQFEESGRGFSFQRDEPLLMTMKKPEQGDLTARDVLAFWSEDTIASVIREYGDERFARRIARKIVESREREPIETTARLVEIILDATPYAYHRGRIHPATRTFQALRIAVNDELTALASGLEKAFERLNPGGRLAVISFHSGEDRAVKRYFRELAGARKGTAVTKKPLVPSDEEVEENPRARSAKLRIIEKAVGT